MAPVEKNQFERRFFVITDEKFVPLYALSRWQHGL
jgi:hypothetical protein